MKAIRVGRGTALAAAVASAMAVAPAVAQTGSIAGTVFRDSLGHGVGGAIVSLPSLDRSARTNYLGEFRIDGVPAGRQTVSIRYLGFTPFSDTVGIVAGQIVEREFVLTQAPVMLDSQRVVGKSGMDEPHVSEFEERRKLGIGYFIDTEQLRKVDGGRPLMNYLSGTIPRLRTYRPRPKDDPTAWYLGGGHGAVSFRGGGGSSCPIAIYIDGVAFYVPGVTVGDVPDISAWTADEYSAVEYYSSAASVPSRYATTQAGCGVLLLWRRYKG
jgi:hypothetical protein